MDHALGMGVLDRLADKDEQLEPGRDRKLTLIAILCDWDSTHQLHDEIGPASYGRAAVVDVGDVRMVH
jgi:hypothetical protein